MADDEIGIGQGGIGYAHAMMQPTEIFPAAPRQPKKLLTKLRRWEQYWEPRCVLECKRLENHDPADCFREFREAFDRRLRALFSAGIAWTVITKGNLDSPLQSGTEFDRALCLAIERRRCRMNRKKGEGKKYANRSRSGHK